MSTCLNSPFASTQPRRSPAPGDAVCEALDLLSTARDEVAERLGLSPLELARARRGELALPAHARLRLAQTLRAQGALMQLAAEQIAADVRDDAGALARDAYARAMREDGKEQAVETALQTLLDLCP